jgi:hypothetical protein
VSLLLTVRLLLAHPVLQPVAVGRPQILELLTETIDLCDLLFCQGQTLPVFFQVQGAYAGKGALFDKGAVFELFLYGHAQTGRLDLKPDIRGFNDIAVVTIKRRSRVIGL